MFGRTPLHDAAGNLHADVVRLLVDAGAPVNVPNRKGVPPYLPAASDEVVQKAESSEVLPEDLSRYEEIVRIFIEKKVDVNLQYPKDGKDHRPKFVTLLTESSISESRLDLWLDDVVFRTIYG